MWYDIDIYFTGVAAIVGLQAIEYRKLYPVGEMHADT
jgi:hypothetical protein